MGDKFKEVIKKQKSSIVNYSSRRRLKNKEFSIISNNCWGGRVYQDLGIAYRTPFVGLFLYAPCYIKLLKNLEYYMGLQLNFVNHSKYMEANEVREENPYPIGTLDDIEIHFLHYKNQQEAIEKWNRRTARINWGNIFIKFSDRDLCTEGLLIEFDNLNHENKICFTAKEYKNLKSNIWFYGYKNASFVDNELTEYKKYFDVVDWLNELK